MGEEEEKTPSAANRVNAIKYRKPLPDTDKLDLKQYSEDMENMNTKRQTAPSGGQMSSISHRMDTNSPFNMNRESQPSQNSLILEPPVLKKQLTSKVVNSQVDIILKKVAIIEEESEGSSDKRR